MNNPLAQHGLQRGGAARADAHLRLLIPVDGSDESRWALHYARSRARRGDSIEVELLAVAEPVRNWQVLQFRTRKEISRFQAERAQFLLEDAAQFLRQAHIPARLHYREGDTAFQILDAAEALRCREIVLPARPAGWVNWLDRNVAGEVMEKLQSARVVTVDAAGVPQGRAPEGGHLFRRATE